MFKEELIIAGFGGQGVLSMGKILAYSGVVQGLEVTWMPSYGPEMRGGTANVTVILSDERISSPIAHDYDTAVILNQQSMDKFEPKVKPGGVLIYDTSDPNGNMTTTLADSGYIRLSDDKRFLLVTLFHGETYEQTRNSQWFTKSALRHHIFDLQKQVIPM